MVNYYLYKITYWNERTDKEVLTQGIVAAESYTKAMQAIVNDYGDESICEIKYLALYNDGGDTLTINNVMFDIFINGHNNKNIYCSYHVVKEESDSKNVNF